MIEHQEQNNLGGFCEQCGGTGRTLSGCQPCRFCNVPFRNMLAKLVGSEEMREGDPPTHKHKCPTCGMIWEHETNCSEFIIRNNGRSNEKAHTCSKCGAQSWDWYKGEGIASFQTCAKAI